MHGCRHAGLQKISGTNTIEYSSLGLADLISFQNVYIIYKKISFIQLNNRKEKSQFRY